MKKKYLALVIFLVVILIISLTMIMVKSHNTVQKEPSEISEVKIDDPTDATSPQQDSESADVTIVESTPTSVTMEFQSEDGRNMEIEIGGKADSGLDAENEDSENSPAETKPPKPIETQPGTVSGPTHVNDQNGPDITTTYEEYEAMSAADQLLFYYSFADPESFQAWYNGAKAEYEANRGDIIVGGDGPVNIGGNK